MGFSGFCTCRVLEKVWLIFLIIPDAVQPLPSSHSSAAWQHRPCQAPTSCEQKPISPALERSPQRPSEQALRSCTWSEAADIAGAVGPMLLQPVPCGTSSPWQGMCLLLIARSLALSCTNCYYGELCSRSASACTGLPHTCWKGVCPLRPGTSRPGAQSPLSGTGQT